MPPCARVARSSCPAQAPCSLTSLAARGGAGPPRSVRAPWGAPRLQPVAGVGRVASAAARVERLGTAAHVRARDGAERRDVIGRVRRVARQARGLARALDALG